MASELLLRGARPLLGGPGLLRSPIAVFAEPDLEEDQEHGTPEADRNQDHGQQLAGQAGDEDGADDTGEDEDPGRAEGQHAHAKGHVLTLHRVPVDSDLRVMAAPEPAA